MTKKKPSRTRRTKTRSTDAPTAWMARQSRVALVSPQRRQLATETHLGMPWADWRVKKRQEWRAVVKALDLFKFGSAYTPVGNDIFEIERAVDRIAEDMQTDWVSW